MKASVLWSNAAGLDRLLHGLTSLFLFLGSIVDQVTDPLQDTQVNAFKSLAGVVAMQPIYF